MSLSRSNALRERIPPHRSLIEITRMNSTLEVMKPFSVAGIPPDELNSFLSGTHGDAFRILGPHRMGDDLAIRAFRPDARKIDIVTNGTQPIEAEKIHRDGFFQAKIPNATRDLDYHLRVTDWNGSESVMRDPYQYGPIMGEVDLHLFSEGQHWQLYEKFGAHLRTIGPPSGASGAASDTAGV